MKPTRPVLRYFGGKWRLAPWIIGHFPVHGCYVEPFCGAASVFLRKAPAEFEVINDLDGDVVNFFWVLRGRTEEFIGAIQNTPYSREEYRLAWQPVDDPLERARRYYVRVWQGWLGAHNPAWRYQHSNQRGKSVIKDWNETEHLRVVARRLKQAFIECDKAIDVIKRYDQPHTLFYVDPPYLFDVRSKRWKAVAYQYEVDENYHCKLLKVLKEIRGMAIISGYSSALYDDQLRGWRRVETSARTTNTAKRAVEVMWLSPAVLERGQRLLFV